MINGAVISGLEMIRTRIRWKIRESRSAFLQNTGSDLRKRMQGLLKTQPVPSAGLKDLLIHLKTPAGVRERLRNIRRIH